ncbi:unnamed protein product, partial [marine sediment metagenome]
GSSWQREVIFSVLGPGMVSTKDNKVDDSALKANGSQVTNRQFV